MVIQSDTSKKASLLLSGAAAPTLAGSVLVSGDAMLQFGSGRITTVASGASLELDGAGAQILTDGGASSALSGLSANDGTLTLQGGSVLYPGGVTVTTTKNLTNTGTFNIDTGGSDGGFGGSAVTLGGTLTNDGTLDIGNYHLGASTTVKAKGLVNDGALVVQGNGASGNKALLLSGAAAPTLAGSVLVSGDAMLQFGSGRITTVASGASLELDGAGAQILTDGGASSALSGLSANDGTLTLQGGSTLGAGGVTVTTTKDLTNTGILNIDTGAIDGGSAVTFGGTLTNDGTLDIGNPFHSGVTTVKATRLVNRGALVLQGDVHLILSGAAAASILTGSVRVIEATI